MTSVAPIDPRKPIRGTLRSAAIGYGLAILAPVIVTILKSLVGG